MPTFQYRALKGDGAMAEGQLDAPGRPDALRQMEALGLRPVSITERSSATVSKNGSSAPASLGKFSLPNILKRKNPYLYNYFTTARVL